jgi:hypothetical protein
MIFYDILWGICVGLLLLCILGLCITIWIHFKINEKYRQCKSKCPKKLKPDGECGNCYAAGYDIQNNRGFWYCKVSPTFQEFEPIFNRGGEKIEAIDEIMGDKR